MDDQTKNSIREAVSEGFSMGVDSKRYIDVSRIPLICQSINQIAIDIKEIKDNSITKTEFWPVKTLVYGITALLLTGVVGALLLLVVHK